MNPKPESLAGKARSILEELKTSLATIGQVFRVPDLRRVELAYIGFNMMEWATYIAIMVYAFERGGAAAAGIVTAVQLIPAAAFAPFGALLGDRFRREKVLAAAYLVQVGTMAATAAALLCEAPLPVVFAISSLAAMGLTLVRPIHGALLPALAQSPRQLTAVYVADGMIASVSALLGPFAATAILKMAPLEFGPGLVYAAMAAALAVSTFLVTRVRTRTVVEVAESASVIGEAAAGFRLLREDRRSGLMVGILGSGNFLLGILDVVIVVLAYEIFKSDEAGTGLLNAALGAGALIGSVVTVTLIASQWLRGPLMNGVFLYGAPVASIALVPLQGFATLALAAAGAGRTIYGVAGDTMLQRLVPERSLSRVLGVQEGMEMASEGIGAVLGVFLIDRFGVEATIIVCGLLLPVSLLLARRRLADADVGSVTPVEYLKLLHALPLFAPLGPAELERVARHVFPLKVTAGEVMIQEGDPGDRFYVIKSGTASVLKKDKLVATLSDGGFFGEIALLMDIPRTATVKAETEMELLVLERAPFLEAVTGHSDSSRAAQQVVDSRMAD